MALSEKRILKSVTVNHQAGAAEVCWCDQILRDDQVISEQNHRKAYGFEQAEEFVAEVECADAYLPILGWTVGIYSTGGGNQPPKPPKPE